jgi:nitronate monooxygenase
VNPSRWPMRDFRHLSGVPMNQEFIRGLGVRYPIVLAPMGGGASTPELVAAVSNAGGLGIIGAPYLTPTQITEFVARVRTLTDQPFGINLFTGGHQIAGSVDPAPALALLAEVHTQLGLPPPEVPQPRDDPFPAQLEAVLEARVPVFSCTFGIPPQEALAALHAQGSVVIGTATTVTEAELLAEAGVDAIMAQGSEAGAHRGTFATSFAGAMIGTMALVPQIVDAVDLPVIASGGIMDGRGIVAAEALGASAVQLGTAFLTCREAGVPPAYKAAVRAAQSEETVLTRVFSGRPARGITNAFIQLWEGHEESILPYPAQNAATRPLRTAAAAQNDPRFLSLWSGQGGRLARDLPAAALMAELVREVSEARALLTSGWE